MIAVFVYLVGLPLSVYLWANLFALRDEPEKAAPLARLAASLCAVLIALLLIGREYLYPLTYAALTIAVVYVVAFYGARHFGLGVGSLSDSPLELYKETDAGEHEEDVLNH